MRKVLYTVITGQCDKLRNPGLPLRGWDKICFTDNKNLTSNFWQIRYVSSLGKDEKKLSREIKILAHKYLPEYDVSLYVDSYIFPAKNIDEFIDKNCNGCFTVKKHPQRNEIYEEATRIIEAGKENKHLILKQVASYMAEGYKEKALYENGIMYRKHNDSKVIELCLAWYAEIEKYSYRDQISLPYVSWKLNFKIDPFTNAQANQYFMRLSKKTQIAETNIKIHEGTPYGLDLQYGKALNEFCETAPENSWILVRDRDTMYLTDNGKQIINIIERYPDTGIFGCMTNRLGLDWQLIDGKNGKMFSETDVTKHAEKAEKHKKEYYDEVINYGMPVGGLFMLFKKSTWRQVGGFREGDIVGKDNIYFDWDFCLKVKKKDMPIRIMKGVYIFHLYRMNKDIRDISHIMRKNNKKVLN